MIWQGVISDLYTMSLMNTVIDIVFWSWAIYIVNLLFISPLVSQGQPGMQGEPGGPGAKGDKGFAGRDGEAGFDGAPGEIVSTGNQ